MGRFILFPVLLLLCPVLSGQTDILLSPPSVELVGEEASPFFREGIAVDVENRGAGTVSLRLVPSRPEIRVEPAELAIPPGGRERVTLSYKGEIPPEGERVFPLILLARGGSAPSPYLIYSPRDYSPGDLSPETGEGDIQLTYYFSPSCRDCREFLEEEIPRLEEKLGLTIGMRALNVFDEGNMKQLRARLEAEGVETDALPVLDTGSVILAGEDMISRSLEGVLTGEITGTPGNNGAGENLPLGILVAGAGLLDGINPCAFSTLIFLLAYLGLRRGDRREILQVGIIFSLAVFLTYTAVGAGAFLVLRQSLRFAPISSFLRWGGGSVLVVLGALSLRDGLLARKGETAAMALQLPDRVKKAVHRSVRQGVRSAVPLLGAAAMGFLVTLYELGCTGQIYLPTLYLMIRRGEGRGLLLLLLYNGAFILPLIGVFLLAYRGLTSERLGNFFKEKLALVKLMTALFFWIAAAFIFLL